MPIWNLQRLKPRRLGGPRFKGLWGFCGLERTSIAKSEPPFEKNTLETRKLYNISAFWESYSAFADTGRDSNESNQPANLPLFLSVEFSFDRFVCLKCVCTAKLINAPIFSHLLLFRCLNFKHTCFNNLLQKQVSKGFKIVFCSTRRNNFQWSSPQSKLFHLSFSKWMSQFT